MIKTKREAFAIHTGMDHAETNDYRYHYGRTSQAVYAFDNLYYCITKGAEKPAVYRDPGLRWKWTETPDKYLNQYGFHVWTSPTK